MSGSVQCERKSNKTLDRLLALVVILLGTIFLVQVVILVRRLRAIDAASEAWFSDGEVATTITSCGFVQGLVINGSFAFLGLPYAVPPTSHRRWRKSEVHHALDQCWNDTYFATSRKKPCWQFYRDGRYDGYEDCLYLDVYTPQLSYQKSPLDVVLYLSGENLNGGENPDLQPSARLAKERNCVFVSISIRRSVLGFLSLQTMSQRYGMKYSGNQGISDLLSALNWVRLNIRHFGGNEKSVTILAHQSGSTIVGALLRAGYRSPLFTKVWMSGGKYVEPLSLEDADEENQSFLEDTDCEDIDCLFKTHPEELLENVPFYWRNFHYELNLGKQKEHTWLVYDGEILREKDDTSDSTTYYGDGNIQIIPKVVIGAPAQVEASTEMRSHIDWNRTEEYKEYLESSLGPLFAPQVYHQYLRPDNNHWQQFSHLLSDYKTICPLLTFSRQYLKKKGLVFNYIAAQKSKGKLGNVASQGSDIKAILGQGFSRSFKENRFRDNMISLFYSFVKTGSVPKTVEKSGNLHSPKILMVDDRITAFQEYSNCDLWRRYESYDSDNPERDSSSRQDQQIESNVQSENGSSNDLQEPSNDSISSLEESIHSHIPEV